MEQDIRNKKIDITEILTKYKNNWYWFVISLIVCIGLASFYIYVKRPVFEVKAKVLISSDQGGGMGSSLMKNLSFLGQSSSVADDELEIIASHSVLVDAIRNLGINRTYIEKKGLFKKTYYFQNSPISVSAPDAVMDTLSRALKFKITTYPDGLADINVKSGFFKTYADLSKVKLPYVVSTPYGRYSIQKTKFYNGNEERNFTVTVSPYSAMAEELFKKIEFFLSTKKSNSIVLTLESANVKEAKAILDEIINLYNDRGLTVKNEIAEKTKKFINERLSILYSNLSSSEGNILSFKNKNGLVDVGVEAQYQLTKKGALEPKLMEAETEIAVMKMVKDFLSHADNKFVLIPFTSGGTETAKTAVQQYNTLMLQYIRLKNNAKPDNVVLTALVREIDALRTNVLSSISKGIDSNQILLNELRSNSGSVNNKLGQIPKQEKEFFDLKRTQSVLNQLYSFLLEKKEENELVLAAAIPKGQVIDQAYSSSEPVAPKIPLVLLGAFIFGLFIPVGVMGIRDLVKTKFSNVEELSRLTSIPVLGEICHNHRNTSIVVREGKTSSIVELFRLIRNNIQFMLPNADDKVILVTSSISGEGKSFISSNIAASLSLLEQKVVIVGMDIRAPQLAQNFGVPSAPGLTNYLSDQNMNLAEIINKTDVKGLDVIAAGPIPPNPSELLLSPRVKELINNLKQQYDYIILDSAPIALVSDTFSLTKYANMVVYVARAGYTQKQFIKYLNKTVDNKQLSNVALVVNDTNSKLSHGYGYGYGNSEEE